MRIVAIVIALTLSILWVKCQWDECREAGLSAFYCIQHVGWP